MELNTTLNKQYMSAKIGHAEIYYSVVYSSFRNVVPGYYFISTYSTFNSSDSDVSAQAELTGTP